MKDNLAMIDQLGSPNTYNHYPTGWAMAFSTPFRMFKRYSYQGGVCDPLVISWPKGIKAKGEVRDQYHHVVDIVPTILDCCGHRVPRDACTATRRRRCPACRCATPSTTPRRRRRRRRSTTRCSARAGFGTADGRRSRCTARRRAWATSRATRGSSSTPTSIARKPSTSPRSIPRSSRS